MDQMELRGDVKMFERLQIRDFQKHDKLRIVFDERITCVTGPSDAGKSSVLRAIRWLCFNRPLGDGFIRHGKKSCSVKMWIDGRKVERRKSKGENVYLIDGRVLEAVGTDVPEEVQKLVNVTSENFQGQHDPLFWFSLSSGEVAKQLNRIVDLDVIDRSASWLASKARSSKAELSVAEKRLFDASLELSSLEYVEDLVVDYEGLLKAKKRADETSAKAARLRRSLETAQQTAVKGALLRSICLEGMGALELGRTLEAKQGRLRGLSEAVRRARAARELVDKPVPVLTELEAAYNRVEEARGRRATLSNLITLIDSYVVRVERKKKEVVDAESELAAKTEGRCPLCGGEWK